MHMLPWHTLNSGWKTLVSAQPQPLTPDRQPPPSSLQLRPVSVRGSVWAVSMVHSRAFALGGREAVMVPFMDAINHQHDNNVHGHLPPATWHLLARELRACGGWGVTG